ncbi:MAG: DUF531 family protein [Candidatus Thermoplasmatota archaeon]|nr:DUF531 family protein [Candidatus Thermoplasmatota archaeon]MBS3802440.1 DUF531 family protein [Candidatus Thermoplasmatota archaeon]
MDNVEGCNIMSTNNKTHDPSFYRGLIREQKSKKGRHPTKLLAEARTITDSYYASLALFRLSDDSRIPHSEAKLVAREGIRLASEEKQLWRRAELYAKLAKYAKTWNQEFSTEDSNYFLDLILQKIQEFPKGKGLSQNINELSKHLGCKRLLSLLCIAVKNNGFILDDSKTVIRQWKTSCDNTISPKELHSVLTTVKDPFVNSKLMGYLYLQCHKKDIDFPKALQTAIDTALKSEENKVDALRYLSRHIQKKQDFVKIQEVINLLPDLIHRIQLLTTLAGHADKKDLESLSLSLFDKGLSLSKSIPDTKTRVKTQLTIAKGYLKINKQELAKEILVTDHQKTSDESLKTTIEKTMKQYNLPLEDINPVYEPHKSSEKFAHLPISTGCMLGLYDTYEGAIKPIHIRTLARAAPLCAAFGLDLALIGFPIKKLDEFIKQATTNTTIGKGGKYVKFLSKANRIHLYPGSQKNLPTFTNNELIVATTDHPEENKSITLSDAVNKQRSNPEKRLMLIMGLGKKGLPSHFLHQVDYQLELTGVNVPLETCTAMGIIAMKLYDHIK